MFLRNIVSNFLFKFGFIPNNFLNYEKLVMFVIILVTAYIKVTVKYSILQYYLKQCSDIWALWRLKPVFLWKNQFELILVEIFSKTNRFNSLTKILLMNILLMQNLDFCGRFFFFYAFSMRERVKNKLSRILVYLVSKIFKQKTLTYFKKKNSFLPQVPKIAALRQRYSPFKSKKTYLKGSKEISLHKSPNFASKVFSLVIWS